VLNPRFKWAWAKHNWAANPRWITDGERAVKQLWIDHKHSFFIDSLTGMYLVIMI
jgi:hypothetical protein